jgi:hypothetical protein
VTSPLLNPLLLTVLLFQCGSAAAIETLFLNALWTQYLESIPCWACPLSLAGPALPPLYLPDSK